MLTFQIAWRMLISAINDPQYSIDQETGIDGYGRWIKGLRLNEYREAHQDIYGLVPHGPDRQTHANNMRRMGTLLKFNLPNRRVFFVLPGNEVNFQILYPEAEFLTPWEHD